MKCINILCFFGVGVVVSFSWFVCFLLLLKTKGGEKEEVSLVIGQLSK